MLLTRSRLGFPACLLALDDARGELGRRQAGHCTSIEHVVGAASKTGRSPVPQASLFL